MRHERLSVAARARLRARRNDAARQPLSENNHWFARLCGRADGYRHWSARAGPDQAQRPIGPNSQLTARCRYPAAARLSHKGTATVTYATHALELRKPSRASTRDECMCDHRTPQMPT